MNIFFIFLHENIPRVYLLATPLGNEYQQHVFRETFEKIHRS